MPNNKIILRQVKLPEYEPLEKWFKEIDRNKIYSNRGPILCHFEKLLSEKISIPEKKITVLANGFSALMLALQAKIKNKEKRRYCIVPSFTFPGTISSVIAAGLEPYFIDIDEKTNSLCVDKLFENFNGNFTEVSAVVPVSTFGVLPEIKKWKSFEKEHNIPVVYDLAWSFDNLPPNAEYDAMVSMHATKVFGIGEGGFVISESDDTKKVINSYANFGMNDRKITEHIGINAKLSEFQAAIGIVALEQWDDNRKKIVKIQEEFIKRASELSVLSLLHGLSTDWSWMSAVLVGPAAAINCLEKNFNANNVESRRWWKNLCHLSPAYKYFKKGNLHNSENLAIQHINIPFHQFLTESDIEKIFDICHKAEKDFLRE